MQRVLFVGFFAFAVSNTSVLAQSQTVCSTTASAQHSPFVPPAPFAALLDRGMFWFGSEKLWVALTEDGHWRGLYRADLKAYRNKLPLFRTGFDFRREPNPPAIVAARRLDAARGVAPIIGEKASGVFDDTNSYIMTALDLPQGCWEITARYASEPALTFVVSVP